MYRVILFDLDGTLTDSGEGITKSVQYAIGRLGFEEPPLSDLRCFVGPPLLEQFMSFCGIDSEQAQKAVEFYRERYNLAGLYENIPYAGITEVLDTLKKQGYRLGVASSKPEYYVEKILKYFSMYDYFDVVVGSELSGKRTGKAEVIEEAVRRLHCENARKDVVLVGDRKFDVYGARAAGIDCLAVSYGYGDLPELYEARPAAIVSDPEEIAEFFCAGPSSAEKLFVTLWRVIYPVLMYYGIMALTANVLAIALYVWGAAYETLVKSSLWATAAAGIITIPIALRLMKHDELRLRTRRRETDRMKAAQMVGMLILGASLAYVVNVAMNLLHIFQLFPSYTEDVSEVMYANTMWVSILCGAIIAPVIEELIFRGLVYRRIRSRFGIGWGILASAVIFGAFHGNIPQFIYAALLGLVFAWFAERFHTVKASILLHIGANMWSFILSYRADFWQSFGGGIPLALILLLQFFVVVAGLVYIFTHPLHKREQQY